MAFTLPEGMTITWFGHAAFRVETPQGKRILLDPWIKHNPSCPQSVKDDGVGPADLLLITHGHFDHIADVADIAKQTGCTVVCIPEIKAFLLGKGVAESQLQEMNKGGTIPMPELGLWVTMTMAFHSGGIEDGEQTIYGGEPSGFVVTLSDGFAFYFAGDTCVFSDMALISELYKPKLAFLPIGNRFTMGAREATKAVQLMTSVEAVVPMHWGTFPILTGTPEIFKGELAQAGSAVHVFDIAPGGALSRRDSAG